MRRGGIRIGINQEKTLLLLAAGVALVISKSPLRQWRLLHQAGEEWSRINQRGLQYAIRRLYQSRLVKEDVHQDGSVTLTLTDAGIERTLHFSLDGMKLKKPKRWDHKWRMILFDIPEDKKQLRDAFRWHLKRLEFYEYQKSVFIHPYECKDELDFLIEFYHARKFIRYIIADYLDNELHIRSHFHLS